MKLSRMNVSKTEIDMYGFHLDIILKYVESLNKMCHFKKKYKEIINDSFLLPINDGNDGDLGDFILRGTSNFSDGYIGVDKIIDHHKGR